MSTPRFSAWFRILLVGLFALSRVPCACAEVFAPAADEHACCDDAHPKNHQQPAHQHADGCPHCEGQSFVKPAAADPLAPPPLAGLDVVPPVLAVQPLAAVGAVDLTLLPPDTPDRPPQSVRFRRTVVLLV